MCELGLAKTRLLTVALVTLLVPALIMKFTLLRI